MICRRQVGFDKKNIYKSTESTYIRMKQMYGINDKGLLFKED